ncbi:hypothetical protein AYO22_06746 [Fonsecaea multimorphosa]|nr:hypothetical protein AYO22_06746 [Fonsecaea multimorphosa]
MTGPANSAGNLRDCPEGEMSDQLPWTKIEDPAERRKVQNRLNKRASRARKNLQNSDSLSAPQADGDTTSPWDPVLAVLPRSANRDLLKEGLSANGARAFSSTLASGSILDQAKVLSPLMENQLLRQIWWTGANILWPSLEEGEGPPNKAVPSSWAWSYTRHAFADPLLFSSLAQATGKAMCVMGHASDRQLQRSILEYETKALQHLREELDSMAPTPRDELLFAVLMIFPRPRKNNVVREKDRIGAFRPCLMTLQHINHGSTGWSYDTPHWGALQRLMQEKGGLDKVTMTGLGEFMQLIDLWQASVHLDRPSFGLCRVYLECEQEVLPLLRLYEQEQGEEFAFPAGAIGHDLLDVIWDIRSYLRLLHILRTDTGAIDASSKPLARYRNVIQHRLLSLRKIESNSTHEACRMGVSIFAYGVTFPFQDMAPMVHYAGTLRQLLVGMKMLQLANEFRLWLLMMGAMAMYDTEAVHCSCGLNPAATKALWKFGCCA